MNDERIGVGADFSRGSLVFPYLNFIPSTAVEQAVACVPVTQLARVRSLVGTVFPDEVFSGFFLTCKTNVRKLWALNIPWISFGHHIHPYIFLFEMNEWVDGVYRLSCSCCLGGGRGIELIPHPGMGQVAQAARKYVCYSKLIPPPDS